MHMSPARNTPARAPRLHSAGVSAILLLAGSSLVACSSGNPVEPTAPAQMLASTGPNRTGFQVGWSVNGGSGVQTAAARPAAVALKDSVKASK